MVHVMVREEATAPPAGADLISVVAAPLPAHGLGKGRPQLIAQPHLLLDGGRALAVVGGLVPLIQRPQAGEDDPVLRDEVRHGLARHHERHGCTDVTTTGRAPLASGLEDRQEAHSAQT